MAEPAQHADPVAAALNPYASPTVSTPGWRPYDGGVWQRDDLLIVHRRAHLPPVCLKTGRPATHLVTMTAIVHPWYCLLGLFLGPIGYMVMFAICVKTARISIGLCDEAAARRRQIRNIGLLVLLSGLLLSIVCLALAFTQAKQALLGVLLGVFAIMIGMCIVGFGSPPVGTARITPEFVWLRGVNRRVRESFPPWPFG